MWLASGPIDLPNTQRLYTKEAQVSVVFCWAGSVMEIMPPMVQASLSVLSSALKLPIRTTDVDPGVQGATVAGTQGVGVPEAAAVSVLQVPKGRILAAGLWSMIVAAS